MDLLCHGCGKHPCVSTRISNQFLFVQLLNNPQGLIRTDLKSLGALILQLRQIKKQRRIFLFFLFLNRNKLCCPTTSFEIIHQLLCRFPRFESIFPVELWREFIA